MSAETLSAPAQPLFALDLGTNGGMFAPESVEKLNEWVRREATFWNWADGMNAGTHRNSFDQAFAQLRAAVQQVHEAVSLAQRNDEPGSASRVQQARAQIEDTFKKRKLPHSSTPLAKRVEGIRVESPHSAMAYLFVHLPNPNNYRFEPNDIQAWHGFIHGLMERYGPVNGKLPLQAQRQAFDELQAKGETMLAEKQAAYEELHRHYADTAEQLKTALKAQGEQFNSLVEQANTAHEASQRQHDADMQKIREAFTEEMKLRGPVGYWTTRKEFHEGRTWRFMCGTFVSFAVLAGVLGAGAWAAAVTSADPAKPDPWKLVVLGLVGVLGIWVVRLVVRMFLSHHHLATDAAERVTMAQTYLALMADEKLPSEDDRKLVLTPLFRPAADGIVKDEGLPHPALELFTRTGKPQG